MKNELRQAVEEASKRVDVCDALGGVYAELQTAIDARRPICSTSGRCCHFEEFGHRLYVSTAELAVFLAQLPTQPKPVARDSTSGSLPILGQDQSPAEAGGCPFQVDRLCGVHAIRPFGCRIFFCDPTAQQWQQDQYELFHNRLKRLHDELEVPYFYVEWRSALALLR